MSRKSGADKKKCDLFFCRCRIECVLFLEVWVNLNQYKKNSDLIVFGAFIFLFIIHIISDLKMSLVRVKKGGIDILPEV